MHLGRGDLTREHRGRRLFEQLFFDGASRMRLLVVAGTGFVLAAFTLWVHLYQFSSPLQFDSHVFLLIGRWVREGLLPYRDVFEPHPPGIFYYVAGVFSVLPETLWS